MTLLTQNIMMKRSKDRLNRKGWSGEKITEVHLKSVCVVSLYLFPSRLTHLDVRPETARPNPMTGRAKIVRPRVA